MSHSIPLKRSLATLASAAGLLGLATGPADAQAASPARCTVTCLDQDLNTFHLKFDSNDWAEFRGRVPLSSSPLSAEGQQS